MKRLLKSVAGIAILLSSTLLSVGALANESVTPVTGEPGVLARFAIDQLPTPHAEIWMLRIKLDPGGLLPLETQIGPTLVVVETGELTLTTDRPVRISHGAIEDPAPGVDVGGDTLLTTGDAALVTDGTALSARNESQEPVVFLGFMAFSGVREAESSATPASAEPINATIILLAAGQAEFPEGPGTLIVERVVAPAGMIVPVEIADGAEIGTIERGQAAVALTAGEMFKWAGAATTDPNSPTPYDPDVKNQFGAGELVELASADGYEFATGTSGTVTVGNNAQLTLLRMRVVPAESTATPSA